MRILRLISALALSAAAWCLPSCAEREHVLNDGLVGEGLVARYYLNEASQGQGPLFVEDAAPQGIDLRLYYEGTDPSYTERDTGHGLRFDNAGGAAAACASTAGSRLSEMLAGTTKATLELVVDIDGPRGYNTDRLFALDPWGWSAALGAGQTAVGFNGRIYESLTRLDGRGRLYVAIVLNTEHSDPPQRIRMYDGFAYSNVDLGGWPSPTQGEALMLSGTEDLCIGNRIPRERAPAGAIYYAAMYAKALSDADLRQNLERLLEKDDP